MRTVILIEYRAFVHLVLTLSRFCSQSALSLSCSLRRPSLPFLCRCMGPSFWKKSMASTRQRLLCSSRISSRAGVSPSPSAHRSWLPSSMSSNGLETASSHGSWPSCEFHVTFDYPRLFIVEPAGFLSNSSWSSSTLRSSNPFSISSRLWQTESSGPELRAWLPS